MSERGTPITVKAAPSGELRAALTGSALGRCAMACAVMAQWGAPALFRRVCRRPAAAVKPGGSWLYRDTNEPRIASAEKFSAVSAQWLEGLPGKGLRLA